KPVDEDEVVADRLFFALGVDRVASVARVDGHPAAVGVEREMVFVCLVVRGGPEGGGGERKVDVVILPPCPPTHQPGGFKVLFQGDARLVRRHGDQVGVPN